MKHIIKCLFIIGVVVLAIFYVWLLRSKAPSVKPSEILRFQPVWQGSDPNDIRIAQAELCRHGIDVKIDGECGKDTALGMCELLCRIQKGYRVYTIYEFQITKGSER